MGFVAIVVETGFMYSQRRDLQRTADAAALAGAQALWWNDDAVADAQTWAAKNADGLVDNLASVDGASVTSIVRRNASSLFQPGHWLSFGQPLVGATATARLGTTVLPGPGIFCVGVEVTSAFGIGFQDAYDYQQAYALPGPFAPPPLVITPNGWYTVLRTGAGAGSNAGYVDIDGGGGGAQEVRDCMAQGSGGPLVEVEDGNGDLGAPVDAEPGLPVGPGRFGLRDRLTAARASGCYSWQEIRQFMLDADQDGDGIVDPGRVWWCSPLNPAINQGGVQATSVVLLPIIEDQFKFGQIQGASEVFWLSKCVDPGLGCDVFLNPDDQPTCWRSSGWTRRARLSIQVMGTGHGCPAQARGRRSCGVCSCWTTRRAWTRRRLRTRGWWTAPVVAPRWDVSCSSWSRNDRQQAGSG